MADSMVRVDGGLPSPDNHRPVILVVDDEAGIRDLITSVVRNEGFEPLEASNGVEALQLLAHNRADLVITDLTMPKMDGLRLLEEIKADPATQLLPVVMITGTSDREHRLAAIQAGCDDFLSKPFDQSELRLRIKSLLRVKHLTDRLDDAESVIIALANSIEARDTYTQNHTERVASHALRIGQLVGMSPEELIRLRKGAYLHDLGKIAVSDTILNKNGSLSDTEWTLMRQHTITGVNICRPLRSVQDALPVIRWHHEKLDGSGYPDGLSGGDIPLAAQIMAVADMFDALSSSRSYKPSLPFEECRNRLETEVEAGKLDGDLVGFLMEVAHEPLLTHEAFHSMLMAPRSDNA